MQKSYLKSNKNTIYFFMVIIISTIIFPFKTYANSDIISKLSNNSDKSINLYLTDTSSKNTYSVSAYGSNNKLLYSNNYENTSQFINQKLTGSESYLNVVLVSGGKSKSQKVDINKSVGGVRNIKPLIDKVFIDDTGLVVELDPTQNSNLNMFDISTIEGKSISITSDKANRKVFNISETGDIIIKVTMIVSGTEQMYDEYRFTIPRKSSPEKPIKKEDSKLNVINEKKEEESKDNKYDDDYDNDEFFEVSDNRDDIFSNIGNSGNIGFPTKDNNNNNQEMYDAFIFEVDYPATAVVDDIKVKIPMKINNITLVDVMVNRKLIFQNLTSKELARLEIPIYHGENELFIKAHDDYGNFKIFSSHILAVTPEELNSLEKRSETLSIKFSKDYEDIVYHYPSVKISGKIDGGISLTVNGNKVDMDSSGKFEFLYKFKSGSNYLDFEAKGGNNETIRHRMSLRYNSDTPIINVGSLNSKEPKSKNIPKDLEEPEEEIIIDNLERDVSKVDFTNEGSNIFLALGIGSLILLLATVFIIQRSKKDDDEYED